MVSYLMIDKFLAPELPTILAPREELIHHFEAAARKRIVYVTAPAGFGKTVSTKLWLDKAVREVLWISLDEYDNAPAVFFSLLCKSLLSLQPNNQAMLTIFNDPAFSIHPLESAIQLINHFIPDPNQHVLVLDDAHLITDKQIRKAFFAVQKRLPHSFTTLILTRDDIDPFEYRTAGGDTCCEQITIEQLAFSYAETKQYFQLRKRALSKTDINRIQQKTNGWPMGINALAATGSIEPSFSTKGFFHEYFSNDIWRTFNVEQQEFLLKTSIAKRITPKLADQLTGRTDSQDILEDLCTRNFFIIRYSKDHYRYHQLFIDFLQEQLMKQERANVAQLYKTASNYYLAQNEIFMARGFALKSGDQSTIQQVNYLIEGGGHTQTTISVKEFINVFCTHSVNTLFSQKEFPYPYLYSQFAGYYFLVGDALMAEYCFDQIEANLPMIAEKYPEFLPDSLLITLIDSRKKLGQIVKKLLKYPVIKKFESRLKWSTLTMQLPFFHRSCRDFADLKQLSAIQFPTFLVQSIFGDRGTILLLLTKAGILYEKNQLDKALGVVTEAGRLLQKQKNDEETTFCCLMLQAAIYAALPDSANHFSDALTLARKFSQNANQTFQENNQAFETDLALHNGNQTAANDWLQANFSDDIENLALYRIYQHFITARALLISNKTVEAAAFLERLRELAEGFHRPTDAAEATILQAILAWNINHQRKAVSYLESALIILQESDYLRVVAAEGAAILPILNKLRLLIISGKKTSLVDLGFLTKSITLAEQYAATQKGIACHIQTPRVKLSKQQHTMLKLLSQGYKNSEIAEMTGLTVHTIKFHLSAAYRKLGVTNRKDAILVGKKKGLLN
ncbi:MULTISPECIES: LuxR C-terminal-related transcriptional regulator [Enterococcus]|uniref:LuxR C-terminal-related transcriptional regulator n=1 Tax=Enterococcus TaxID=1350 RepID=UPI0022E9682E|nr:MULTISPECIES: LuxR C-terminal-related transcriptional regulator [Enterococcus]